MVTVRRADGTTFQRQQWVNAEDHSQQSRNDPVAVAPGTKTDVERESAKRWKNDPEWEQRNHEVINAIDADERAERLATTNQRVLSEEEFDKEVNDYLVAQIWSAGDMYDEAGEPLLKTWDEEYDISDFDDDTVETAREELAGLLEEAPAAALEHQSGDGLIGHDFALTRNRHGVGFWDRGTGDAGERLTQYAHEAGAANLWVSDSGKLILE